MKSENRRAYFWNTISGIISAGQSAVILIVISRHLGIENAGAFTIAYAVANLVGVFAKYGVRNFQVTDIEKQYSFAIYLKARIVSIVISILLLVAYLFLQVNGQRYTAEKATVVFGVCVWKLVDALEDVFIGAYQQRRKLSFGACYYSLRLFGSSVLYCVLIVWGFSLISATNIMVGISVAVCIVFCMHSFRKFRSEDNSAAQKPLGNLLKVCFPLCVGMTLSNYIGNAPKYTIDNYMDDAAQAYFGYIMMPAFVILLLSNFIYQPLVRELGVLWGEKSHKKFFQTVMRQFTIVILLTLVAVVFGTGMGIPILSFVYGVDLSFLKREFLVLLIGGGAYALVSYLTVVLTTVRMQNWLAGGFVITAFFYRLMGKMFVNNWGIMGVTVLYLGLNVALIMGAVLCLCWKAKR